MKSYKKYLPMAMIGLLTFTACEKDVKLEEDPPIDLIEGLYIDSRDSAVYKTIRINGQNWFAENLKYDAVGSQKNPKDDLNEYGRLYIWETMMNGEASSNSNPSGVQGICPNGWHIPSDEEWQILERSLGMKEYDIENDSYRGDEAIKLKSNTDHWSYRAGGDNSSMFNALPAGRYNGGFEKLRESAFFWTSTADDSNSGRAWYRGLNIENTKDEAVFRYHDYKQKGMSCRCVED